MRKTRMFGFIAETWNPIVGCSHNCVYCWARRQAQRQKHRCDKCYTFTPHLHKERLFGGFRKNSVVFVCSMADMFGDWVPSKWISEILEIVEANSQTTFFFETKNPKRYLEFADRFPDNVILSVTLETDSSVAYNLISKAPIPLERYMAFRKLKLLGFKTHVSIEPILCFNFMRFLEWLNVLKPEIVSIGYNNYPSRRLILPEPPLHKTMKLIEHLERIGVKVERKTLRKAWWEVG